MRNTARPGGGPGASGAARTPADAGGQDGSKTGAAQGSFKTGAPAALPKKVAYVVRHRDAWRHHGGRGRRRPASAERAGVSPGALC